MTKNFLVFAAAALETFFSDRSHDAFGARIPIGRLIRRPHEATARLPTAV
jgi:hypothetical protein